MSFQIGKPRHPNAGRKKGTPNKSSGPLEELAQKLGIDPFEVMIRMAGGDWKGLGYEAEVYHSEKPDGSVKMGYVITPEMRLKASSDACQYLYPKKKAIELTGKDGENLGFEIVIKDYSTKNET